jgi:hypothetical protein
MSDPVGLFPVFTLLLGYGMKYLTDWVQHNRTLERERETRRALKQDVIAERSSSGRPYSTCSQLLWIWRERRAKCIIMI